MRAITVRNPHAAAMFLAVAPKNIENRTWKPAGDTHGPLAIVSSAKADLTPEAQAAWDRIAGVTLRVGAVVGVVELLSIHQQFDADCHCVLETHGGWARATPLASPRPMLHWMLGNPRKLASEHVFPYTGFLGIRTLNPDFTSALEEALV